MRKLSRILALILCFMMLVGVLASCTPAADDTGSTTGDAGTTTDGTTQDDDEAQTLSSDPGILIVGTNPEFPPFESIGDNGAIDGFDIALINAIAEKMGKTVRMESMEFKGLIAAIGGRIDIAIAGMTVNEERKDAVDFTDSYFTAKQYVLVAKDNDDINTLEDLNGKKIGVQEGTTGDFIATDDIENADVKRFSKAATAVMDLVNGRLDAVIIDSNPAQEFARTNENVKIIGQDFFEDEYYAIAVPKNQPELLQAINDAIAALKDDGTYDRLLDEYIMDTED